MQEDERKLLLKAADVIELRGWCQRALQSDDRVCLVGALRVAAMGHVYVSIHDDLSVVDAARKLFESEMGLVFHGDAVSWNDEQGREKNEVVQALREVGSR